MNDEKTVYIGTSGYSYKDWKGPFYPLDAKPDMFLRFYAGHFPFVELNFSYYRQPSAEMMEKMVAKTPENFLFVIKAHRSLTHDIHGDWKNAAVEFLEGIAPLTEKRRLAGILFQFPNSFARTDANRLYIGELTAVFEDLPVFVEFRKNDWLREEVFASLRDRGIGFVNTDNPSLETLPERTALATSEAGYIRFHGRNKDNWWTGTNVSRYDYLYTEEELKDWISRIQKILEKATVLYIAFNNHHKGQAVINALQLAAMLRNQNSLKYTIKMM